MTFDNRLYSWLHGLIGHSVYFDAAVVFTAEYLPVLLCIASAAFVYYSKSSRSSKINLSVAALCSAVVARYVVTALVRLLVHRARPFTSPKAFSLFVTSGSSFPSAHATVLFALGTVLFYYNKKAGCIFYGVSLLVCVARVIAGVHFPSDIIAGIVVGITTASLVLFSMPFIKMPLKQNT